MSSHGNEAQVCQVFGVCERNEKPGFLCLNVLSFKTYIFKTQFMRQIKHDCQPNLARGPQVCNCCFEKNTQKVKGKLFQ